MEDKEKEKLKKEKEEKEYLKKYFIMDEDEQDRQENPQNYHTYPREETLKEKQDNELLKKAKFIKE